MKQAIITVLVLLLGTLTASADILRGRIIDAETKEPLPEASLELKQQADYNGHLATWIMRSNTDSVGCFNMRLVGRGTLSASMLGYYTKTKVVMGFSDMAVTLPQVLRQAAAVMAAVEQGQAAQVMVLVTTVTWISPHSMIFLIKDLESMTQIITTFLQVLTITTQTLLTHSD